MALPRTINILGHKIRIVEVDRASAVIEGIDGEFIQASPGENYFGVIRIDKAASHKKKRLIILHELQHALNDIFWSETNI